MKCFTSRVLLSVALSVLAVLKADAKPVEYGIKAGMDSTTVSYSGSYGYLGNGDFFNQYIKSRTGMVGGVFVTFPLAGVFSIQPEMLYVQRGWVFEIGDIPMTGADDPTIIGMASAKSEVRTSFLEVPILAKATLPLAGPVKPSLYAGPSMSIKLGADEKDYLNGQDITSLAVRRAQAVAGSTSKVFLHNLKSFGLGLNLGAEVAIGHFLVDARYGVGLMDLYTSSGDVADTMKVTDRVMSLMAGYRF